MIINFPSKGGPLLPRAQQAFKASAKAKPLYSPTGSPFRGAVRGRPLGACFPLPLPSNSSALRSPLGPSFPIRCSGIPFRPVLACSCSSESLKSDRSLLVLESESCLQAKLRSSSENLFTASKGALFSCEKSAGEDRKLPECLPKTLLKVLRRGLSCCPGPTVGLSSVGLEERVGISMGWVRLLVGELERPFPIAERLGPPVVRAEPRTPDTSLEESVVMKRVFFFAKDAESEEEWDSGQLGAALEVTVVAEEELPDDAWDAKPLKGLCSTFSTNAKKGLEGSSRDSLGGCKNRFSWLSGVRVLRRLRGKAGVRVGMDSVGTFWSTELPALELDLVSAPRVDLPLHRLSRLCLNESRLEESSAKLSETVLK